MSTTPGDLPGGLASVPVAAIIPGLQYLLLTTVLSSFLIPTAIVLFVFSTPILRRQPIFILNVCAIGLGLIQGMVYMYVTISQLIVEPLSPTVISVITALCIVVPICVQTILLLRVLAVYPPRLLRLLVRMGIYGPLLAMKVARIANAFCLIYEVRRKTSNAPGGVVSQSAAVWSSPFAKSELFLQLVDDVYVSALFLLRIHPGVKNEHRVPVSRGSYASRLRTLFWIALSNLVFPVIFDIAQLILIFRDGDFVDGSHVITANSYIAILGVLFSTIWASGSSRMAETASTEPSVRSRTTSYGTPLALGDLCLAQKPLRHTLHGSRAIPPELKVRSGSRTDMYISSVGGQSADRRGSIA